MIKLSVVIVNYKVKYFTELALQSLQKALVNITNEVFVVDNYSQDDSLDYLQPKFPDVNFIASNKNLGFSGGNNLALRKAKGEYVLLLNPDTVLQEDTLTKCLAFIEAKENIGALGIKMIDGKGQFLPESKRSLPTPMVAFYKMFGFTSLFPKSKTFGKYHLGNLSENQNHVVDILAGAFMLIPKKVLDKVGLLDEDYFMYGEDVDLSYRITKAGYTNYYFAESEIIHYKGESTKKGSLNYVKMFYNAMVVFAKKHYTSSKASLLGLLINIAVYVKAGFSLIAKLVKSFFLPFLDAASILGGFLLIIQYWEVLEKGFRYPDELKFINIPIYLAIWIVTTFFSGGYDKPFKLQKLLRGVIIGTVIIAAVYGFLNEDLRFSRALIILGGVWAFIAMGFWRLLVSFGQKTDYAGKTKKTIIAGNGAEANRIIGILNEAKASYSYIGFVGKTESNENYLGSLADLPNLTKAFKVDEVIFSNEQLKHAQIISSIKQLGPELSYKIVPFNTRNVIGSNSKNTAGDLYNISTSYAISQSANRRNKRVVDLLVCLFTALFGWLILIISKNKLGFIKNWWQVLFGKKTWVGYFANNHNHLPNIKTSILNPVILKEAVNDDLKFKLNQQYAQEYSPYLDLRQVWKNLRNLGNN